MHVRISILSSSSCNVAVHMPSMCTRAVRGAGVGGGGVTDWVDEKTGEQGRLGEETRYEGRRKRGEAGGVCGGRAVGAGETGDRKGQRRDLELGEVLGQEVEHLRSSMAGAVVAASASGSICVGG